MYENKKEDFHCRNELNGHYPLAFGAHLHYHLELVYMVEGCTTCAVDTGEYTLQSGDVLLVFPNQVHRYDPAERERYLLFIINPDMMPELSRSFAGAAPTSPIVRGVGNDPYMHNLLMTLSRTEQMPADYRDAITKGYLLAFFGELLSRMTFKEREQSDSLTLRTIVSYCAQNYSRELTLATLEEELHLSKYYISHLFGNKIGTGFNDYINALRVSEACRYLRRTNKSITEISALVGFGTLRTFNRAFIKQVGTSPSEYRKSAPRTTDADRANPEVIENVERAN
ncbi:MAG: helix-turn-helix transcriptional regulator [Clostridia bacterium]|nr:helix-turn-helix transcriptional regulator [Clostridia bacterium]